MTQPVQVATQASVATSQSSLAPQMRVPGLQEAVASSQVSVPLQATPSLQSRAWPWQVPAEQVSFKVQNLPSSQRSPSRGLQAVVLRAGSQTRQALSGSVARAG
ncbi:MAG: hypothetical protein QM765_39975 [Myxococcales bacterium]